MYERFTLLLGRALTVKSSNWRREEGQTVVEYGLVLAFVAIALALVLVTLKTGIDGFLKTVSTKLGTLPGF